MTLPPHPQDLHGAFPALAMCLGHSREGWDRQARPDLFLGGGIPVGAASRQQGLHSAGEVTGWGDSCGHNLRPGARLCRQGRGQFTLMKKSGAAQAGVTRQCHTSVTSQAHHTAGYRAIVHCPNLSSEIPCGPLPFAGNSEDVAQHLGKKGGCPASTELARLGDRCGCGLVWARCAAQRLGFPICKMEYH